jgi:hypothetical protein
MSTRLSSFTATLMILAVILAAATRALGISFGTVGHPNGPVTFTVNNQVTFTASNFQFVNHSASGGAFLYGADDINIDLATGGATTGLLTFSKNTSGPTPGVVFVANPGETSSFVFSYDLTITPASPGTVDYTGQTNSFQETHTNNALATFQTVIAGGPSSQAFTGHTSNSVALSGQPATISVGNIVTLSGNTGNTGVSSLANLLETHFTADVPEPTGVAVIGGVVLVASRRLRGRR